MTTKMPSLADPLADRQINPADIVRILRRYIWGIVALTVLGGSLAYIYAKFLPKQYDAVATLHLDQHGSFSLGGAAGSLVSDEYDLKLQTEIVALQGSSIALEVMRRLQLAKNPLFNPDITPRSANVEDPATRAKLVKLFESNLTIANMPKTEILTVTYRSKSPVLSALIANTLVDVYLEQSFQQRYRSTKDITGWLTNELTGLKLRIQQEQEEMLTSQANLGIAALPSSSGQGGNAEVSTRVTEGSELIDAEVKAMTDEFTAEAEYATLRDNPQAIPPNTLPGAATLVDLQNSIVAQQATLDSLEATYGSGYVKVQQARAQLAALKQSLAQAHRQLLASAQQQLDASRKTVASIQSRMEALRRQTKAITPQAVKYALLRSQYISDETLYNTLLSALGTGSIEAGMRVQEINRMEPADTPGWPAFPNIRLDVIVGCLAGLLIALCYVAIVSLMSDTVESVEHVEETLPIPILASVPEYKQELASLRVNDTAIPLVTLLAPRSAGSEAYRLLRTAINLMPVGQTHRVLCVTSCGPGEGKSTSTLNLAVVLATQGKRVLLIDADLRKPTIAQRLRLSSTGRPGLSRYLSDGLVTAEECLQPVPEVPGLDVIPVQEIPPFPSELLAQGRLEELLAWARLRYDYVLIDTPPVMLVTDALIVASHADTLLLVVRIGVAQRRALRQVRQDLAKYPGKHAGVVVNAVPASDTYYGGYGKYRYYGGKGDGTYGGYYGSGAGYFNKRKN